MNVNYEGFNRYYSINSPELMYLRKCDDKLDFVIQLIGDLHYNLHTDSFEHFMKTIIGQMLSNRVGDVLSARFSSLCGQSITPEKVCNLSTEELRGIGLSKDKSEYILSFANYIYNNPNYFSQLKDLTDEDLLRSLQKHRGIGGWSSKMYAIFVLDRLDILPYEDGAFLQSIKWLYGLDEKNRNHPEVRKLCEKWSPYRSLAARYMYRVLDSGFVKKDIEDIKRDINYKPIT